MQTSQPCCESIMNIVDLYIDNPKVDGVLIALSWSMLNLKHKFNEQLFNEKLFCELWKNHVENLSNDFEVLGKSVTFSWMMISNKEISNIVVDKIVSIKSVYDSIGCGDLFYQIVSHIFDNCENIKKWLGKI
jgi:hypothetical protein